MSEIEAGASEFLLAEYEALRRKLDVFAQEQFVCARWALAFTGIFWAYLAIDQPGWLPGFAYWTPAIVVGFLGLRTLSLLLAVRKVQLYIVTVEEHMQLPNGLGWEGTRHLPRPSAVRICCWLYWVLLLALNIGIAAVYIPILQKVM
jgi:hypothetical protein